VTISRKLGDLFNIDDIDINEFLKDLSDEPDEYYNEVIEKIDAMIDEQIIPYYKQSNIIQEHQAFISEIMVISDSA